MSTKDNETGWDGYSDQPHVITDKSIKKAMYARGRWGLIKTALSSIWILFNSVAVFLSRKHSAVVKQNNQSIGLGISLEKALDSKLVLNPQQILEIVNSININRLSIRIPLHDSVELDRYIEFIQQFKQYKLLIVILQDRKHIEDLAKFEQVLSIIFKSLSDFDVTYQIGNAVNRRKWGFNSQDDYFRFYQVAYRLRNKKFKNIKLIGGAVIDFDMPDYCRSLLNFQRLRYDGFASLLYVDRRGAPENKQLGFNLLGKIKFINNLIKVSNKSSNELWITEVNWPLEGTKPYAPAEGDVLVNEQKQADYLARYFLLVLASGSVTACFWHQLLAPGYGLIDNRNNTIRYHPSFYAFQTICKLFNDAQILSHDFKCGVYSLIAYSNEQYVCAVWCNDEQRTIVVSNQCSKILSQQGKLEKNSHSANLTITGAVTYLVGSAPDLFK